MPHTITEAQLQADAIGPRISKAQLDANIKKVGFIYHGLLTICVLTLQNDFTVTGESACASPENYKKETGEKIARENAEDKVWALMGYELRSKLALVNAAGRPTGKITDLSPTTYLGTKVVHGTPMNRLDYNILRGWELPEDENGADEGFLVQYTEPGNTNVPGFDGYVSWSPRDIFEKSYVPVTAEPVQESFTDRMKSELFALEQKMLKLRSFFLTETFGQIDHEEQVLMQNQLQAMELYHDVLARRLSRHSAA